MLAFSGKLSCEEREDAVRNSRCSDGQMAAILLDTDRTPVAEASKKQEIIDQGIYR